jgi:hypothetical protein
VFVIFPEFHQVSILSLLHFLNSVHDRILVEWVSNSWKSKGHPSWYLDNTGMVYKFGEEAGRISSGFSDGDIIVMILNIESGILEFYNESQQMFCGRIFNVFGSLVFGVQAEDIGAAVEIVNL